MDLWYMHARCKYVWDKDTFEKYVNVILEVVQKIIKEYDNKPEYTNQLASPNVGFFGVTNNEQENKVIGYALYVSDARLFRDRRRTIFSEFKSIYELYVGRGIAGEMLRSDDVIREIFPKDHAEEIIQRKYKRLKLVGDFTALANKSLNHRRAISPRLRYQILKRDNSTCQNRGRRAPEVRLHVDHIEPVSWGTNWISSNHPNDYQTLCEDCNLGKGDLSWMYEL